MVTRTTPIPFVGVDAIKHLSDKRKNNPAAEYRSPMADEARRPVRARGR